MIIFHQPWLISASATDILGGPTVCSALVATNPTFFLFPGLPNCPLNFFYNSVSSNLFLFQFSFLNPFFLYNSASCFSLPLSFSCIYPSNTLASSQQCNWSPLQQIKFNLHKFTFRAWPIHFLSVWPHFFPSCWLHVVICSSPGALLLLAFLSLLL